MDEVIDSHCHFGSTKDGLWNSNLKDFIDLNKEYNVKFIPSVFVKDTYPEMMKEIKKLIKIIEEQGIFLGISVTVSRDEPDKAIEFVKSLSSNKILVLKPLYIKEKVAIDSPGSEKLVKFAIEKDLPLFFHCSFGISSDVLEVGRLAAKFPKAKFIIGHFGGSRLAFDKNFKNTIKVFGEQKNMYIDISGPLSCGLVEKAVEIDNSRVLFSTDFPVHYFGSLYAVVKEAKISDSDKKKIFYENAKKLFKL